MLKQTGAIILGLLLSQTLLAVPYTVDDFEFNTSLSDAETSLRVIDLPLSVYNKMQRRDYGDLRIFNAEGQIVPHQFSHEKKALLKQQTPLEFFPFSQQQVNATPSNIQVIINQKQGKQNLQINQQLKSNSKPKSAEYQYIIKNPEKNLSLCKLSLNWKQTKPSMILPFTLEASDTLQTWQTLDSRLVVSRLNYGGSQLSTKIVNFSCTTKKYLRLSWLNPEQNIHLQQIQALYSKNKAQQMQWSNFGKPYYDDEGTWLFESDVISAIRKIEFVAPQDGLLYKGTLYSRNSEEQRWNFHKEINQYRLNMGATTLKSNPIEIMANSDRYWKLALVADGQLTESQLPEIKVAWMPVQLHFLAQGKGPFQLAFGNPSIASTSNHDLNDLIKGFKDSGTNINKVSLNKIIDTNKSFEVEDKTPWKLIILWLVLIAGTGLMGFMAFRLFKPMKIED